MWDLVVGHGNHLLAVLEAKSIASSFGNNMNNRAEEAIGSGKDFEVAFREQAFQSPAMPWAGYFLLLPDKCGNQPAPWAMSASHANALAATSYSHSTRTSASLAADWVSIT